MERYERAHKKKKRKSKKRNNNLFNREIKNAHKKAYKINHNKNHSVKSIYSLLILNRSTLLQKGL